MLLHLHTSPSSFEYTKLALLIVVFDRTFPKLAKLTIQKLKDPSFIPVPVVGDDPLLSGPSGRLNKA
jgi:hypothetical protein